MRRKIPNAARTAAPSIQRTTVRSAVKSGLCCSAMGVGAMGLEEGAKKAFERCLVAPLEVHRHCRHHGPRLRWKADEVLLRRNELRPQGIGFFDEPHDLVGMVGV